MRKRWLLNRTNPEFVEYLSRTASVSPLLAQILINRGLKSVEAVRDFLEPGLSGFSDPHELPGMAEAVERIKTAAANNERVLVHGDYDTDGITATAIMVTALRATGIDVDYFIPNRTVHGYGFNPGAVGIAKERGARLIITVDCGISSFNAAGLAKREGIDVIITDHHEPSHADTSDMSAAGISLPEAFAIVNPKLCPPGSGPEILCGAGVAFKVAQALALDRGCRFSSDDAALLLDLAALGTLADVVPLKGENRHILKGGMESIHSAGRPGIRALKEVCGLNGKTIKSVLLAFTMVPRMNAAGRMNDASHVVRLLLTEDYDEALGIAAWLDGLNAERQKIGEEVYQEARRALAGRETEPAIVLSGEGWHEGVLGIVASRIAEEFYRPAFVLSIEQDIAKGSARSIPPFDICAGLEGCRELLISCGGHKQAAGVRLRAENISDFEKTIKRIARESLGEDDLVPSLEIDAGVALSDITHGLVEELEMLEPFGFGNPEPIFGAKGLEISNPRVVGNNHLKMRLKKNTHSFDSIGFNMAALCRDFLVSEVDAAFVPSLNVWNGRKSLQLILKALRPVGIP